MLAKVTEGTTVHDTAQVLAEAMSHEAVTAVLETYADARDTYRVCDVRWAGTTSWSVKLGQCLIAICPSEGLAMMVVQALSEFTGL